jgi:signal transduction histidine kinase
MRLADFISANTDPILEEWISFAASCGPAGKTMDVAALRDHALPMLHNIVRDLRTSQTAEEQDDKAKGLSDSPPSDPDTAAEVHGSGRAVSGFTVAEMVSEYRSLRASVVRRWTAARDGISSTDMRDLVRFNEAIDQALAESISRYTADLDRSKEMFVAVLGHDLRTPIGTVMMASQYMIASGDLAEPHLTLAARIERSGARMNRMVADLLDFTRTRLGSGVPIVREEMDMARAVRHAIEEMESAHPQCALIFSSTGDLRGHWDGARISQVLSNLLGNAVQHGATGKPITITAREDDASVVVDIHNFGPAIAPADMDGLFGPYKRLASGDSATASNSLGLGLYIAERIVAAHGGTIDVQSSESAGTRFRVQMPKDARVP